MVVRSPVELPWTREAALARVMEAHTTVDRSVALARDPVQFPRRYVGRHDREIVAMFSALLAFGNVETIRVKLTELYRRIGPSPAHTAVHATRTVRARALRGFVHRTFEGVEIARLLGAAGVLIARDGGLYVALERAYRDTGNLRDAWVRYADELRTLAWGTTPSRSARHLLPDPRGASACKRLALLSRWIVRADDGVDLGLADLPTRALVIPLDVHIHRVSRVLGFTQREGASWKAAEEVTEALRALDPNDPVKFDFALCHAEIDRWRTEGRPWRT